MNMASTRKLALAGIPLLAVALMVAYALAQAGLWDVKVSGPTSGGGTSSGGGRQLEGVIGQPFIGTSTGGQFTLEAGLLGGGLKEILAELIIPLVTKD